MGISHFYKLINVIVDSFFCKKLRYLHKKDTMFKRTMFPLLFFALIIVSCGETTSTETTATETTSELVASNVTGDFKIDPSSSYIGWEGFKPASSHYGVINIKSGSVSTKDGQLTGGNFSIDMNTLEVTDLKDTEGKFDLEAHLKGLAEGKEDHFFDVAKHPNATFEILEVSVPTEAQLSEKSEGFDLTHMVKGALTLKGITKKITVESNILVSDKEVRVNTPQFLIDRTSWGIKYGSQQFFDDLKDNLIKDEVGIKIVWVATKS